MSPMLYSQLALIGNYSIDDLKQFRQWGSPTPGHPEVCQERGIENTSGPLGQGHTYAVGAAIAAKALYARTGNPGFDKEKFMPTYQMVVYKRKYHKAQVALQDT